MNFYVVVRDFRNEVNWYQVTDRHEFVRPSPSHKGFRLSLEGYDICQGFDVLLETDSLNEALRFHEGFVAAEEVMSS